ncbi:MAG: low temperature requirement protein A [bacterium]|nr:low temperature requirement protein A [bacterium]
MFKSIWQPPRLFQAHPHEHRRVTWLELFYDLVYVATVVQLGNLLSDNVSVVGFLQFAGLFVTIWWSWTGITFYMNRFISDDILHRLLMFTQIFAIALAALSIEGAFGALSAQFALAYAVIRLILTLLYIRAGAYNPQIRPLTRQFTTVFAIGTALFVVSAFVPQPFTFMLWAAAIVLEFSAPLFGAFRRNVAEVFPPHDEHMTERFGIFTLIVLGEAFLKVISEEAGLTFGWEQFLFSLFGMIVLYALWWLYFDDVAEADFSDQVRAKFTWIYSHLPLQMAMTAFGVAAVKLFTAPLFEPLTDRYRLLYSAALILYLVFLGIIDRVTVRHDRAIPNHTRAYFRFASAAIILGVALFGGGMTTLAYIVLMAALFSGLVLIDLFEPRRQPGGSPAAPPVSTAASD